MILYDTIYTRRQVRSYNKEKIDQQSIDKIINFISNIDQIKGLEANYTLLTKNEVNGGSAPYNLLFFCDDRNEAYANVGYVAQKADLFIQSLGFGSGWFMGIKPKKSMEKHCITLSFGCTDIPFRNSIEEFDRVPKDQICKIDNSIVQSVRLAPSSMNSQPWSVEFNEGKVTIADKGRGLMRAILLNKLNKIDLGIATRHATLALEQAGKIVTKISPKIINKDFQIEIFYQ